VRSNSKSVSGAGARDPSRKGERTDRLVKEDKAGTGHLSLMIKLESDVKRLKCDLQLSRNRENELRDQIVCYMSSERSLKSEISSLLVEKSGHESRINSLISSRAGEKQTMTSLEKKLAEEKKQRSDFQLKLETERKSKKEAKAEMNLAHAQQNANSATVNKLEQEVKALRDELGRVEARREAAEEEAAHLRKSAGRGDPEKLMAALNKAQGQQEQLEHSLSSETKIMMDLFSALGEAKRQLQIRENMLMVKDREILDLKGNIAEMLAVMPGSSVMGTMSVSGLSAAPGGHRAGSGLFTPYSSASQGDRELGIMDLPPGTGGSNFSFSLTITEGPEHVGWD
jgi:chromosome segregation ATPase